MTVTATDMGTYLGIGDISGVQDRLAFIINQAQWLCMSITDPLPDGSDAVVVDVVTRAFLNAANVQQEATGPSSVSWGAVAGGLWLTRQNKATLRRLAGGGGVVAVDMTPATALQNLPWWDVSSAAPPGDFDIIP